MNSYNRWFYTLIASFSILGAICLTAFAFMGTSTQLRYIDGQLGLLQRPTSATMQVHYDDALKELIEFGTIPVDAQFAVTIVGDVFNTILENAIMSLVSSLLSDLLDKTFGAIMDFIDTAISFVTSAAKNVFNVIQTIARKSVIDFGLFKVSPSQLLEKISGMFTVKQPTTETQNLVDSAGALAVNVDTVARDCAAEQVAERQNTSGEKAKSCDPGTMSAAVKQAGFAIGAVAGAGCQTDDGKYSITRLPTNFNGCVVESDKVGANAETVINENVAAQTVATEASVAAVVSEADSGECPGAYINNNNQNFNLGINDLPTIAAGGPNFPGAIKAFAQSNTGQTTAQTMQAFVNANVTSPSVDIQGVPREICGAVDKQLDVVVNEVQIDNPCGGTATGCGTLLTNILGKVIQAVQDTINSLIQTINSVASTIINFVSVFSFSPLNNLGLGETIIGLAENIKNAALKF
jgi:hypothetical protein